MDRWVRHLDRKEGERSELDSGIKEVNVQLMAFKTGFDFIGALSSMGKTTISDELLPKLFYRLKIYQLSFFDESPKYQIDSDCCSVCS